MPVLKGFPPLEIGVANISATPSDAQLMCEVLIFDGMTQISGQMLHDLLTSADNSAAMYGEKRKQSVALMMACMGTRGQAFIDSAVEIARAVHRTMQSLGYQIGPETSKDISNVRSTLTTVKPEHIPGTRASTFQ